MDKVSAIIKKEDKFLIGKIRQDKLADFGGIAWVFPGGSMEAGETPEQATVREGKEETGLNISIKEKIGQRVHPVTGKTLHYFHCLTTDTTVPVISSDNDDLESLEWVSWKTLEERMPSLNPQVKDYFSSLTKGS